ncbi:MAG: pitrilysin family protein [Opitutus sp.]
MKTLFSLLTFATSLVALSASAANPTPPPPPATTKLENAGGIASRVVRTKIAGIDLIAYPTGVKDVVTLRGSLPAGDAYSAEGNVAIATLTGMLLDQGTTKQDKFQIAEKLESVGATLSFEVDTEMAEVNAKCLKKDVPLVISLIAEQLRFPALSAEEFEKAKKQFTGNLERQLEDTGFRAKDAFSRAVYPVGHPNRSPSTEDYLAAVEAAKLEDVVAFHKKHYGPAHFTLVAVGDLDVPTIQSEVAKSFAGWTGGVDLIKPAKATTTDAAREQNIFMPEKTSVSVVIGQATGLRYSDPDYQALRLATSVLGGSGFSGRLMQTVRDQEGLTYGINSGTSNDTFTDGDWRITATFGPALLDKGIASTKRELTKWYNEGISAEELNYRKTNLIGLFKVNLATTDGMAASLLNAIHRGYDQSWLDQYPKTVEALTLPQVNGAIKKYLKPDSMVTIKTGTIPGATPTAK